MNVIILTAGLGTRLRPHTFSKPKPLVNVAGKALLAHILDTLQSLVIDEMIFVTGYLGYRIEEFVKSRYSFPTRFIEQTELYGQAHAIYLAREAVSGPTLIVFGDGIFSTDLDQLNTSQEDGTIFVKEIDDPRRFGVVVVEDKYITRLVEKPETPISNLAVIGVYYVAEIRNLFNAIATIMERNIQLKGEYYLADALQVMINDGCRFTPQTVTAWHDCGNPEALLSTNRYLIENGRRNVGSVTRSIIIPPVYISDSARVENSVIGPYVAVADGATILDSRIKDSIINSNAHIKSVLLHKSLIGDDAYVTGDFQELNVGDSSEINFG